MVDNLSNKIPFTSTCIKFRVKRVKISKLLALELGCSFWRFLQKEALSLTLGRNPISLCTRRPQNHTVTLLSFRWSRGEEVSMTRSSALVTVFVESRSVITSLRGSTGTDFDPLAKNLHYKQDWLSNVVAAKQHYQRIIQNDKELDAISKADSQLLHFFKYGHFRMPRPKRTPTDPNSAPAS